MKHEVSDGSYWINIVSTFVNLIVFTGFCFWCWRFIKLSESENGAIIQKIKTVFKENHHIFLALSMYFIAFVESVVEIFVVEDIIVPFAECAGLHLHSNGLLPMVHDIDRQRDRTLNHCLTTMIALKSIIMSLTVLFGEFRKITFSGHSECVLDAFRFGEVIWKMLQIIDYLLIIGGIGFVARCQYKARTREKRLWEQRNRSNAGNQIKKGRMSIIYQFVILNVLICIT